MSNDGLLYRGNPVFFHGKNWVVPSLSVAQFEEHFDDLTNPPVVTDRESMKKQVDTLLPIIAKALQRNYPEIRSEDLRNWLDLGTFKQSLRAIQNASGLEEAGPGEA